MLTIKIILAIWLLINKFFLVFFESSTGYFLLYLIVCRYYVGLQYNREPSAHHCGYSGPILENFVLVTNTISISKKPSKPSFLTIPRISPKNLYYITNRLESNIFLITQCPHCDMAIVFISYNRSYSIVCKIRSIQFFIFRKEIFSFSSVPVKWDHFLFIEGN